MRGHLRTRVHIDTVDHGAQKRHDDPAKIPGLKAFDIEKPDSDHCDQRGDVPDWPR